MFYEAHTFDLDTNQWSLTPFEKRRDCLAFVESCIKYPGEYNLKYTQDVWNEQAVIFQNNKIAKGSGHYPKYVKGTVDHSRHWIFEEEKCLFKGFLIYRKPSEGLEYAVPCLYYWYLNYCPIPDKVKGYDDFPNIYDGDLHYFLYILKCILLRQFGVVLKKRQYGMTLKNMGIKLNALWFGRKAITKIFAWDENKVRESWAFMTQYRDHNNKHCAWKRGFDPGKDLDWHMRRKQTDGTYIGRDCQAKGFSTKQSASNGVGGSAALIFGEEAGINPSLDKTHEFITSNVALGGLTTGLIIYSGSVGELDHAQPLKEFILHPEDNGFTSCPNNIDEDVEFGERVGFFAPEWWNYVSVERDEGDRPVGEVIFCYDKWGNSDKQLALSEIAKWREKEKKKGPEKYRYYCSQRPLSIREAFAWRKESKFPANLVQSQTRRIQEKQYPVEWLDIERGEDMQLKFVPAKKTPIREFPINKGAVDKEGCIEVYERPAPNPELGDYIVSIDPIRDGKTVTSYSLFCILGYRVDKEVREYGDEVKSWIEPGKLVFEWTGRFDDHNKTCELAAQLIKMYNARAVVEANAYEFCTYMISKRMQHHLVAKNQMLFLKEFGANEQAFQEFGWKNTGNPSLFEKHLISYINGFLQEELDTIKNENTGVVFKTVYGIERLPSLMIMKEMASYQPGLNVDRLIALGGLIAYLKLYLANYGYKLKEQAVDRKKEDPAKYLKPRSFFKQAGDIPDEFRSQMPRSPFRNLK